jgi:hypothetical protein
MYVFISYWEAELPAWSIPPKVKVNSARIGPVEANHLSADFSEPTTARMRLSSKSDNMRLISSALPKKRAPSACY